jgi:hypothetical protein
VTAVPLVLIRRSRSAGRVLPDRRDAPSRQSIHHQIRQLGLSVRCAAAFGKRGADDGLMARSDARPPERRQDAQWTPSMPPAGSLLSGSRQITPPWQTSTRAPSPMPEPPHIRAPYDGQEPSIQASASERRRPPVDMAGQHVCLTGPAGGWPSPPVLYQPAPQGELHSLL